MPALLSPLWLLGLGALAVPIVIHLISRGRAPVVRVGSVRWIGGGDTQNARRLRPTRLWLLALRALLLTLVVLALAEPRLPATAAGDESNHVLVAAELLERREELEPANPELYKRLDAAVDAGEADVVALAEAGGGVWSRLREAALELPGAATIDVYAPERLELLDGRRPVIAQAVVWHAPRDPATRRWIETGAEAELAGITSRERTRFERRPAGEPRAVEPPAGRALILYGQERETDARYVAAGLAAVGAHPEAFLAVETVALREAPGDAEPPVLVFELSPEAPSTAAVTWAGAGATLVTDAGDRWESCVGRMSAGGEPAVATLAFERCSAPVASADDRALTLWWRADGRPLLTVEPLGAGRHYRFHSRFLPSWSNLVLDPFFLDWLLELAVAVGGDEPRRPDLRAAAPEQRQPRRGETTPAVPPGGDRRAPELWLWGAVAALVAIERMVAVRPR